MDIYLVRHGDAVSASENPLRPLSATGCERVERLGQAALQRGARPAVIWHSGILRAMETAEILARRWTPAPSAVGVSGLLPEDDPAIIAADLEVAAEPVMLVSHLPLLGRLLALLLRGDPDRTAAEFAPASMVCLARAAEWKISWQIAP
jgi:phosphohistidine phosphatase SixA